MTGTPPPTSALTLRQQAEATIQKKSELSLEELRAVSPEVMQLTLHELDVHQIELEMQNEELRRTQLELDDSRARYLDLYDFAPVGYVTVSEKGLVLEANLTLATLLGMTRGELVAQPFARFIFKEDQDSYYLLSRRLLTTDSTNAGRAGELRIVKRDGGHFWARLTASAVPDKDDHPTIRIVLSDISAQKQAEAEKEKLATQNRQLQKAESLGRMAGAIAHHFNNQLQTVMLSLERATLSQPEDSESAAALAGGMQSAREAAEVSTLMLTYLGQQQVKNEPLDLSAVFRQGLPLLRAAMPAHLTLETDLPSAGPIIRANANQLQQLLTNLLNNACEASETGPGGILLRVTTVSAADILVSTRSPFPIDWQPRTAAAEYACLEVADVGCGIKAHEIDKLFDPFFSTKFTGRGLGLPVVLGIARSQDGVVTVESDPGRGSKFRVYFPLSAAAVTVPQKSLPESADPISENVRPRSTVLVAEDDPILRSTLALMLTCSGFTVLEAEDGVVALEIFRRHRDEIGCVVSDLRMPRMNGWETLAALRQLAPGLPVILVSGFSEDQVMGDDYPERPQAFLNKPFEGEALIREINQLLPKWKK